MFTYLSEVISTVFRPSVVAVVIAVGAGIASSAESTLPGGHSSKTIDVSCSGVLGPICKAVSS